MEANEEDEVTAVELSGETKDRVEAEVRRVVAELRSRPTQEKEDALGLELATLPPGEREYATSVLLQIVAEERA